MMKSTIENISSKNDDFIKLLDEFKNLQINYAEVKRENEFMRQKLRFLEANGGMSFDGSIGMSKSSTSTSDKKFNDQHLAGLNSEIDIDDFERANAISALKTNPTFTIESSESFDNIHLADLKGELADDKRNADDLMKRNSQYPPHLRDSYAIGQLNKDVNEREMKQLGSPSLRNRKQPRPSGIPTPKHARYNFASSSTLPTNSSLTAAAEKSKQATPSKSAIKNFFFGHFPHHSPSTKNKDEVSFNFFFSIFPFFCSFW